MSCGTAIRISSFPTCNATGTSAFTDIVLRSGVSSDSGSSALFASAAAKLLEELATNTDSDKEREVFNKLQALFVEHAPAIPLFPGPSWGEQSEERFTGFPSAENPYAPLSPNIAPASLLVLTQVRPR